jgi:hypothetical protein
MRPGQVMPNEFELAILNRLARKDPSIEAAVDQLHVLSREFTGVGSFTNFSCDELADAPEHQIVLDHRIKMPGVPHGMSAVLFCKGGRPQCLEVVTYEGYWDGVYDGFVIE